METPTSQNSATPLNASHFSLANAVVEIEKEHSKIGWDGPGALYALVYTKDLLTSEIPANLREELANKAQENAHLTAILQEDLALGELEKTLATIGWPPEVTGVALCLERIVLPPEVEEQIPQDQHEAEKWALEHPNRDDVRICVGVLRTGQSWCALRSRKLDDDTKVGQGSALTPGLIQALSATLLE